MGDESMEMNLDDAIADAEKARDEKRGGRGRGNDSNPPLPPGPRPSVLDRLGGGGGGGRSGGRGSYDRGRGGRGRGRSDGGFRQAETLDGWTPSGNQNREGKDCFIGTCEGCSKECEVFFRPVKGGNPPVCNECHQSLRQVRDDAIEGGYGGSGPDRGRRGSGHSRYNPYGRDQMAAMQQMMGQMYAAAQMQAGRGRGRGRGRGAGRGRGSNKWVRPGSELEGAGGAQDGGGGEGGDVAM